MADILASITTHKTPQKEKARADQVKNRAGGYVFQIGDDEALHRFLTLGTDGPSYYASAPELTRENAEVVFRMAASKPDETIQAILDVSEGGRAPKNKQAIFALAICASAENVETRAKALAVMHRVCRTGTMLFQFNTYVENLRGRGPALNRAVANWYLKKDVSKVAYQVTKYRQRDGWAHRDLLRLVKPGKYGPKTEDRDALFEFITKGTRPFGGDEAHADLAIIDAYLDLKDLGKQDGKKAAAIIANGAGVSWEMIPDALINDKAVWEAMLAQGMPQTALMRQLNRLTEVFGPTGSWVNQVASQIQDKDKLIKGRVHPVNVLIAMRTYAQGHNVPRPGAKMRHWPVATPIVDAMDAAFYNAFAAVEPTGKHRLIALDVSGSMTSQISDIPISCREMSAAMAMVTLATEAPGTVEVIGFTSGRGGVRGRYFDASNVVTRLDLSPRRRLDDAVKAIAGLPFGATDCALPFVWAAAQGLNFESVEIYTDNETWAGPVHVHQAAKQYRQGVGHDVKLIAVGMTATNYSVVDPKDPSGLNVSGFDSAVPNLTADFVAGRL